MSEPLLQYQFLPYLRQGMAATLKTDAEGPRATTTVAVGVKGYQEQQEVASTSVTQTISLYGPGDVTGFDAKIVAHTNPRSHVGDFEPNLFPHVEFVDPDFPWRFTPGVPQKGHQLIPWVSLIVLRVDASTESTVDKSDAASSDEGQPEILEDGVSPERRTPWVRVKGCALPDFGEAWRWAHVQVAEIPGDPEHALDFSTPQAVGKQLADHPTRAVARLLCPRRLRPKTRYRALVVPTFELGRQAGLEQISDPHPSGMDLINHNSDEVTLPYYYQWEFGTGSRGDFEYLVRRLEPRRLTELGRRTIRVAQPGYGLPGVGTKDKGEDQTDLPLGSHDLELEGALQSLDATSSPWGMDAITRVKITPLPQGKGTLAVATKRPTQLLLMYDNVSSPAELKLGVAKAIKNLRLMQVHNVGIQSMDDRSPFAFRIICTDAQDNAVQVEGTFQNGQLTLIPPLTPGQTFRTALAEQVLNVQHDKPTEVPLVGPPVYGHWHARRETVDPRNEAWLDTLNLDPRHRAAAGIGAQVIREHQEALMAEAWEQAGEIEEANQLIRQAQLACELSISALNRVKKAFHPEGMTGQKAENMTAELLRWAAPAFSRLWHRPGGNVQAGGAQSPPATLLGHYLHTTQSLMPRVLDSAFLRMARMRGPIRKRQGITKIDQTLGKQTALPSLTKNRFYAVAPAHSSSTLAQLIRAGQQPISTTTAEHVAASVSGRTLQQESSIGAALGPGSVPGGRLVPSAPGTQTPSPPVSVSPPGTTSTKATEALLDSVRVWMKAITRYPTVKSLGTPADSLQKIGETILQQLNPMKVIPQQVNGRLRVEGPVRQKPIDMILAAPRFSQAMYEPLMELDQNWILPGVEKVPQNTLAVLKSNRRFIEAYLCGLNHEWMRELVWREYPTDQRGTSFRQFWDVQDAVQTGNESLLPKTQQNYLAQQLGKETKDLDDQELWAERLQDILPLSEWKDGGLGAQANIWGGKRSQTGTGTPDQLVLLIRGDLIKKYPHTVVYAVEAVPGSESYARRRPALREYFDPNLEADKNLLATLPDPLFPIFSAHLPEDMFFFGFPFSEEDARTKNGQGYFFVLEERVSETRFGLDLAPNKQPSTVTDWKDLTWSHFVGIAEDKYLNSLLPRENPTINNRSWRNAAAIAAITLQGPFRVAIHATQMLPKTP